MEDNSIEKDNLLDKFNSEKDENKQVDILIELIKSYVEKKDFTSALKYCAFASICTTSPRADICCLFGDLYTVLGNIPWAKLWYKAAINNVPNDYIVESMYYTWYPMLCISSITDNPEESKKYLSAVEIINPNYLKDVNNLN